MTWGTSPEDTAPITGLVPDPAKEKDPARQAKIERSLDYMGLKGGMKIEDITIDTVFIGSCTNSRIEDLRAAAEIAKGRKVSPSVRAMIVPGSGLVKQQAEEEGLADIFIEAGFDWREAGCSMCLAMNADRLSEGSDVRRRQTGILKAVRVVVAERIWLALKWRSRRRLAVGLTDVRTI